MYIFARKDNPKGMGKLTRSYRGTFDSNIVPAHIKIANKICEHYFNTILAEYRSPN